MDRSAFGHGTSQLAQVFPLLLIQRVGCKKADICAQIGHLLTQGIWEHRIYFSVGGFRRSTILVIKGVSHEITAQRQDQCFLSGETQGWQEIPARERIPFFLDRDEGNACFRESLQITVDSPLADFKSNSEVFRTLLPFSLELKNNS